MILVRDRLNLGKRLANLTRSRILQECEFFALCCPGETRFPEGEIKVEWVGEAETYE